MLQFDDVTLRRGPRLLVEHATFQIHPGKRVGLTGANGCGKSSLFSLVLGELSTDAGSVSYPSGWVIAHLAQEIDATARPAIEYVIDGDSHLRALQRQLTAAEQHGDGTQIAHLHAELEHVDGYQADARAGQLMAGLGFHRGDEQRPLKDFSGGWRMRLNLARTLMCRSDLMLLDEPSNHLDLDAVIWLENWLRRYRGTLVLISHDREFLDHTCDQILHIERRRATLFNGNYSQFERLRADQLAAQQASYARQKREIDQMQRFVDRFRAKATKARQAQSRLKALERMARIAPAHVDSPFHFSFDAPNKNPRPLLVLDSCSAGYGDQRVLDHVGLELNPGDRIGLLGPNGAGKSTLIKLIAGALTSRSGTRREAQHLQVGYFAQHQLDQLQPTHSPLDHLRQLDSDLADQAARDYLGGFGFTGDKALEPVAPFSGGEKSRLALALLIYRRPNLLLLDEPTNHLDLTMRQALATALQSFEGAMVIVSHDRHLLRVTCDRFLLVIDQHIEPYSDTIDAYPAWLTTQRQQDSDAPARAAKPSAGNDRRARKRADAERRKALDPLKRQAQSAEARMNALHAQRQAIEQQLTDPQLYVASTGDELQALLQRKAAADKAYTEAEEAWLDAAEALEQAETGS